MRTLPLLFIFLLFAGCAGTTPAPQSTPTSISAPNRVFYGVVQAIEPSQRYLVKDACAERDDLCALAKQTARETEMARVEILGTGTSNLTMQVLVPKSQVKNNDIIQYRIPPPGQEGFPAMIGVGAKAEARRAGVCDWVDGAQNSFAGGVVCNGWSYKGVQPK
ncbi:MAG: hypothetical protein H0U63_06470 [Burkholderiales bacterium]|nr:hypothetical protein [Burkholderiales bacterium]